MASEDTERDRAVRAMLVDRVASPQTARGMRLQPERFRVGIVTAVVLVAIVALSVVAVRFGADRGDPAQGGLPASNASSIGVPEPTVPAGAPLGRYTSADGPVQRHTIHPNGLAIAYAMTCSGRGTYRISISHESEESGDGGCGGGASSGNKGHAGSATVTITMAKDMVWTMVIVGIPETYVTPRPIPTPTDSAGAAVPYCTAADLTARFAPHKEPEGVTEVSGGELVLTNSTTSACALAGYPEVRFLSDGTALGHNTMNATDDRSSAEKGLRAVILRPGGHAYSQIGWYLVNYYPENEEGACQARAVTAVQVDLAYDLSSPGQTGTLDVPIGKVTACLNGAHGALGRYGQISSTVFVDYSIADTK